jgi:hypothetical protein
MKTFIIFFCGKCWHIKPAWSNCCWNWLLIFSSAAGISYQFQDVKWKWPYLAALNGSIDENCGTQVSTMT